MVCWNDMQFTLNLNVLCHRPQPECAVIDFSSTMYSRSILTCEACMWSQGSRYQSDRGQCRCRLGLGLALKICQLIYLSAS